jgi:xanthine dehydrogenase YagR molybdenum-binding subunit
MANDKERLKLGFKGEFKDKDVALEEGDPAPWDPSTKFSILGTRVPRLDGRPKTTGEAKYASDVRLPGMLYGKILRCPLPAATLKSIDVTEAKRRPGVRAALAIAKAGEKMRFAGQEVAAIAADTPEQAIDALSAVKVEYAPLPFVVSPDDARKDGAPLVFEKGPETKTSGGDVESPAKKGLPRKGNVVGPRTFTKGDVDKAFREPDVVVVEGTYRTQVQNHTALETHGLAASWEGDSLTVWASTQSIFSVRDELAEALEIPAARIRVLTDYMGGGFGAKFGPGVEGIAAAKLAKEAGAPVKLFLDRKEEQLATGNRPSSEQWIKVAAKKDGTLTALHLVVHGNGGTNGGTGASGPAKNIYACPNVKVEEYDVFTNAGPSAAFRAPGHPQGAFVLEAAMDELAKKVGMDPLAFRVKNDPSEIRKEEFRIGAEKIGWSNRDAARKAASKEPGVVRGVGVGASVWYNTGGTGPRATVTILRDGSAQVEHGVQDLGTGARTMVAIVAAEELGIPLEKVTVAIGDTRLPFGPGSGGSTTTPSTAPTIRRAAHQAKKKLAAAVAKSWKVEPGSVTVAGGRVTAPGEKHDVSWAEACKLVPEEGVSATAERAENHDDAWQRFISGAQFAEVEVDTETGKVKVLRVVAVHDCGLAVNALTTESQIQGGVIQGLSYAMYENRILDRPTGKPVNPNVEQYKIAGALDVPEIDVVIVPVWDGVNNTHSTGIGEPATVPTAAAIANAVSHAVGARIRQLPITPEVVLAAVEEARTKGGAA